MGTVKLVGTIVAFIIFIDLLGGRADPLDQVPQMFDDETVWQTADIIVICLMAGRLLAELWPRLYWYCTPIELALLIFCQPGSALAVTTLIYWLLWLLFVCDVIGLVLYGFKSERKERTISWENEKVSLDNALLLNQSMV